MSDDQGRSRRSMAQHKSICTHVYLIEGQDCKLHLVAIFSYGAKRSRPLVHSE
jgi:hypothetical protein